MAPGSDALQQELSLEEARKQAAAATEGQLINAGEWLEDIRQIRESGNHDSAIRQLREFRAHFPDFPLALYCAPMADICKALNV